MFCCSAGGMVKYDEEAAQIVLHEDKQYYPSAQSLYPNAEILVEEEDTQPLETPIIAPVKHKVFEEVEKQLPTTEFAFEYVFLIYGPNVFMLGLHTYSIQVV